MKIEIIKGFCCGDEVVKIVKSNGESLHIFNEEAISFFTNGAIVLFGSEPFSSALRLNNIKNYKYGNIETNSLFV